MTTFADVLEQLAALSARTITLDDLPIGDLRKKLFDNGEPLDPSVTLLPSSITGDALSSEYKNFYSGNGSPETVVTASVGAIYRRLDGGAATTLYVKETGTSNTGWVAK